MYIAIGNSIGASSRVNAGGGGGGFTNTYSLAFDGVDDYVECSNISALNGVTTATWMGWFNRGGTGAYYLMSTWGTSNPKKQFGVLQSATAMSVYMANSVGSQSTMNQITYSFSVDTWYHLAFVYDESESNNADKMKVYVNGVLQTNNLVGAALTTLNSTTQNFEIGKLGGYTTNEFNGKIDEVAIFTSALTSENISTIYNSGVPNDLTSLNPTAWYRMGDNGTWKSPQWLIPNNENKTKFSNYSFEYDGIDDFVDTGSSTLSGETALSISAWVYPTAYGDATAPSFVSTDAASPRAFYLGLFNGTNFRFSLSTNGTSLTSLDTATSTVTLNAWQHILVTWDQINLKLYKNGVLLKTVATTSSSNGTFTTTNDLLIGARRSSAGFFEGNIDEVAIWNSVQDASTIYNSGTPNDLASLSPVGYWRSEQSNFTDNWLVDNSALSNYSTRSFNFDGVDDYIPVSGSIISSAGDMTISSWANFSSLSGVQGIFDSANFYSSGFNGGFSFRSIGTNLNVGFSNGTVFDSYSASTGLSTSGGWYHLAFTFNNTTKLGTFYLNGVAFDTHTYTGYDNADLVNGGVIGRAVRTNSYCFTGSLDEISIFNSIVDVATLYNSGEPARIEGAVAHWRMGEDATFNTNWNVPDQVGSSTGTSANMTIADLEGEAPNYTGGGLSNNMTIEDRVGDAPNSTSNALSYNMDEADRVEDVPS